jgi:hypothetical protein
MRTPVIHRAVRLVLATVLVVVGLAACGDDDDIPGASSTTTTEGTTTTSEVTTTAPDEEHAVRVYFLHGEEIGAAGRTVTGEGVAAGAVAALLDGPDAAEEEVGYSTTIPEGTELRGVTVGDGVATVDLSAEFATGGGSLSMQGRVAQVVFTLTQFDTVTGVDFLLDGEPITELGGEGLILDHPQTRQDWEDLSPAILVESPLPLADVTSPLHVTGTANTFEATFVLNVLDGDGLIVYDEPVMATSGTGTRGTFDVTATFEVPRAGVGAVIVFERSAKDGSQINVVEVPVHIS